MRGLICEDHPLMRETLVGAVRDSWTDLQLEEAGDNPAARAQAEAWPDFCSADLAMSGAGPLAGTAGLRARLTPPSS